MIRTRNPILVIFVSLIPMLILSWIFSGTFNLVKVHLSSMYIENWKTLGVSMGMVISLHVITLFYFQLKKKALTLVYALSVLTLYSIFIYLFIWIYPQLMPANLPGWLTRNIILFYTLGFILPSVIHCLSIIVLYTAYHKRHTLFQPKLLLIILCYGIILFRVFIDKREGRLLLFVISTSLLIYVLLFLIYLIYRKVKAPYFFNFILKLMLIVALPTTVLILDTEILYNIIHPNKDLLTFILFAIVNGISLFLPNRNWKNYRLILFMARSMAALFIVFLFAQFGANLPLSISAFAGLGLGVCCTAPVLFVLGQPLILLQDFRYLSKHFSLRTILTAFLSSFIWTPFFL